MVASKVIHAPPGLDTAAVGMGCCNSPLKDQEGSFQGMEVSIPWEDCRAGEANWSCWAALAC